MSFLDKFFGKDPKSYFFEFDPRDSLWSMVTWNFDLKLADHRQWMVEIIRENKEKRLIQWLKKNENQVTFFENGRTLKKKTLTPKDDDYVHLMNLSIHSTLKTSLENHQSFMTEPVSGATTIDMQNEFRYLQWIQASFGMVTRALDNMKTQKEQILTGAFFSGIEPETQDRVMRLIIFNLDIFYYMSPDQILRIVIFDDKNLGHGESRNPSFQQIIKVTKPQFYDEIVKLVHHVAAVGEVF